MKIDRIKISMEFNVMGNGLWLTAESGVAPDEDIIQEFKKNRQLLIDSFKEMDNIGVKVIEPLVHDEKTDKEFKLLKIKLSKFRTGQEAFDYLATTQWKHTIEAKQFINTKFSNNDKQKTKRQTDSGSYPA